MFGVPIMLEYDVLRGLVIVLEAGLNFIPQDGYVKLLIRPPINLAGISHLLPHHTSPYHHRTTTKLHCSLHHAVTHPTFTLLLPHPFLPIRSQPIYLSLISIDNPLPVLYSPIFMCYSKVHPLLSMSTAK